MKQTRRDIADQIMWNIVRNAEVERARRRQKHLLYLKALHKKKSALRENPDKARAK